MESGQCAISFLWTQVADRIGFCLVLNSDMREYLGADCLKVGFGETE